MAGPRPGPGPATPCLECRPWLQLFQFPGTALNVKAMTNKSLPIKPGEDNNDGDSDSDST